MTYSRQRAITMIVLALAALAASHWSVATPVTAESCDLERLDLDHSGYLSLEDVDLWERAFESRQPLADLDGDGFFRKEEKRDFYPALASAACKELLPPAYQRRGVMPGPGSRGGGRLSGASAPEAGAVADAVGGPDGGGYRYADSDVAGFPVNFVSIRGTGTQLTLGDDTASTQALPFPFPFYGQMRGSVDVASNGYLTFGSLATDFSNDCPVPSTLTPDAAVHGHWDDLLPNATNNVIVQSFAKGKCPGLRAEACFIAE